MKDHRSGVTEEQRLALREALTRFTEDQAARLGCPPEAIVQEMRYWQQSNRAWPTNPRKQHKLASFHFHHGICVVCKQAIESIDDATFHHWERGIPEPHSPTNMIQIGRAHV